MSVTCYTPQHRTKLPQGSRVRRRAHRRGMSLLEVMVATVMLLGCVMALSRLAFLARRHAVAAEDRTLSQTYCQNIMQELLSGVRPVSNVSPESFEGGEWVYLVNVETLEQSHLVQISVTVDRLEDPEGTLPTEDEIGGFRLVRWFRSGKHATDTFAAPDSETSSKRPGNVETSE